MFSLLTLLASQQTQESKQLETRLEKEAVAISGLSHSHISSGGETADR